jgi:flagellar basal-body rod protein FlgC
MFQIFDIAGQGMSAQSVRLNTTASNMANAESVTSNTGSTYKARHPVFAAIQSEAMGNFDGNEASMGVQVLGIVESQAPLRQKYQPNHPMSDEKGYVHLPNVNVVQEMANMISASRSYQNNAEILNTTKQLMQRTLMLGQ